jgi:hypothetical protein
VNDEDDEDSTVLRVCSRLVPSRMETDVSSGADEEAAQQQEQAAIAVEARAARVRRSQVGAGCKVMYNRQHYNSISCKLCCGADAVQPVPSSEVLAG